MQKYKTFVKEVILLNPGKWGIIMDFVLEEKLLLGKELLVDYDETDDISEARDGCLMIETLVVPVVLERPQIGGIRSHLGQERSRSDRTLTRGPGRSQLPFGSCCDSWSCRSLELWARSHAAASSRTARTYSTSANKSGVLPKKILSDPHRSPRLNRPNSPAIASHRFRFGHGFEGSCSVATGRGKQLFVMFG